MNELNGLPQNISQQVLEYLLLEYSEEASGGLQLEDLVYDGKESIDGVDCHCWSFPTLKNDSWATVSIDSDNNLHFGFARKPQSKSAEYSLFVEIDGPSCMKQRLDFVYQSEYQVSVIDEFELQISKDNSVKISAEISHLSKIPLVSVLIVLGDHSYQMKGAHGVQATYSLNESTELILEIGDLDCYWS